MLSQVATLPMGAGVNTWRTPMKALSLTLLIIFGIWFFYPRYERAQAERARARFDFIQACTDTHLESTAGWTEQQRSEWEKLQGELDESCEATARSMYGPR